MHTCCCASMPKNITKLTVHPVLYCLPKHNLRDWTVVHRLFIIRSLHYFFNMTKIWQLNVIWFTQFVHQIVASTIWLIDFVNWSAVIFWFHWINNPSILLITTCAGNNNPNFRIFSIFLWNYLICKRYAKFWNLP